MAWRAVWRVVFPQTLLRSFLPTNSLLAKSYNDVFDWLKLPNENCYIRELSVSLNNDCMWLLHAQNTKSTLQVT